MNPILPTRWLPALMAIAVSLALFPWSCSTRVASGSYLGNRDELVAQSRQSGTGGYAAAFVLWITDTLPGDDGTPPPQSAISGENLRALRADLETPSRPGTARIVRVQNDGAIAHFQQVEAGAAAAPIWMSIMFHGQSVSTATVVRTPDEYDIFAMIQAGIEELLNINASGTIEGAGLKSTRRLDFENYPNLAAVRRPLSDIFSARAVEGIVQSYGMYEREGTVSMPARDRPSQHSWERAEIQSVKPNDTGFVVRLQVPTRNMQRVNTIEVPFVLTFDGWRIDAEIVP